MTQRLRLETAQAVLAMRGHIAACLGLGVLACSPAKRPEPVPSEPVTTASVTPTTTAAPTTAETPGVAPSTTASAAPSQSASTTTIGSASAAPSATVDPKPEVWVVDGMKCVHASATIKLSTGPAGECGAPPIAITPLSKPNKTVTLHAGVTAAQRKNIKDACCYQSTLPPGSKGRPLRTESERVAITARPSERADWRAALDEASFGSINRATRARVGAAFAADGLVEHASVAEFARFSLALMALGAPADLVVAAHRAAVQEIDHARITFGIASALLGEDVGPGPIAVDRAEAVPTTLAALVATTLRDGCIGETVASIEATVAGHGAEIPSIARALARIGEEEREHGTLAFAVVKWAIERASPSERAAIDRELALVIAEASHEASAASPAVHDDTHDDTRFGRLPHDAVAGIRRATLTSAVLPALAALRERVVAINA